MDYLVSPNQLEYHKFTEVMIPTYVAYSIRYTFLLYLHITVPYSVICVWKFVVFRAINPKIKTAITQLDTKFTRYYYYAVEYIFF